MKNSHLTEEQQVYMIEHNKEFYEGWKAGIDVAQDSIVKEIIGFLDRNIPQEGYEFLPATEHRGGFWGGYEVARLDNSYIRQKIGSLFDYLRSKSENPDLLSVIKKE